MGQWVYKGDKSSGASHHCDGHEHSHEVVRDQGHEEGKKLRQENERRKSKGDTLLTSQTLTLLDCRATDAKVR